MNYILPKEMKAFLDAMNNLIVQVNGLVSIAGSVNVSNFPSTQPVSGTFYPAVQPVSGTFYQSTQPVSLASLPMAPVIQASTATITVSAIITTASVKIIDTNSNRKGLFLYNNSANTVYVAMGSAANSSNNMTFPVLTFATLIIPSPIFTGPIYGIRNAGTGTVLATELT